MATIKVKRLQRIGLVHMGRVNPRVRSVFGSWTHGRPRITISKAVLVQSRQEAQLLLSQPIVLLR